MSKTTLRKVITTINETRNMPIATGARVTVAQYEILRKEYLKTRSIVKSADAANINRLTATRLIEKGANGLPPIRAWADAFTDKLLAHSENKLAQEMRVFKGLQMALTSKATEAIRKVKLEPTGTINSDGTITISEAAFNTLVRATRSLMDMGVDIDSVESGAIKKNQPPVNVGNLTIDVRQQTVNLTPEQIRQRAENITKEFSTHGFDATTKKETALAGLIAAATGAVTGS